MMPLEPSRPRDSDMGELSPLVFSPRLPPIVEPLAPSPRRTNNPPVPPDDDAEALWSQRQRIQTLTEADLEELRRFSAALQPKPLPQPPSHMPWFGLVVGAALFAVGYLLGRWLP